jgi:expansin
MVGGQWDGFGQGRPDGRHRRGDRWPGRAGRRWWRWSLVGLGVTGAGMAVVALAVAVGVGQVTSGRACAATFSGSAASGSQIATHYVYSGTGNCSFASPPADGMFVALSPAEYDSAAACGGYLRVTGPDGSAIVEVIDQCPACATGHLDLSETAFARLAPLSAGLINVSYSYLANPALPGPVTAEVKEGSSQYWLALNFDNTGNPLASVEVKTGSGGWLSLSRANYNYWIAPSGAGNGPFIVRLADTQGHQVTVGGITLSPGAVQSTGTYMYGAGGTTTIAPSTPTAAGPTTSESPGSASPSPTAPATPMPRRSAADSPTGTAVRPKAIVVGQPSSPPSLPPSAPPTC